MEIPLDVVIRPLSLLDAAPVADLIRMAFADQGAATDPPSSALRETPASVAAKLAEGGGWAGESEGMLIGALLWTRLPEALYLGRLAVAPAWRGRGLAARLIRTAEAQAASLGRRRLHAHARISLPMNRGLFAKLGYVEIDTLAHPGYREPTIVVMEKALD